MKFRSFLSVMAVVAMLGCTAGAAEATTAAETEIQTGSVQGDAADTAADKAALSDKWSDFQIQVDGEVYQFPMTIEDFQAHGWEIRNTEDLETELEPYQYTFFHFDKGDVSCTADVLNLAINNQKASACLLAGMDFDEFYWPADQGEVILPGGIVRGKSDADAILAAYGTPSDTYEGTDYVKYTYRQDYDRSIELTVSNETGVLGDIEIRNFVKPDGFAEGDVSDEVPADVAAYQKPETLSDDLTAYEMEYEGEVYALPVPVSTLIADGWELQTSDSEEYVMANSSGWVKLMKGGASIRTMARNEENYATVPENCWVEELEIGTSDENMNGTLPGGIKKGMSEQDFLAVLDKAGAAYETDESSDYIYYTYNKKEYDQACKVTVYKGDGDYYEKDTVISISCSNAFC